MKLKCNFLLLFFALILAVTLGLGAQESAGSIKAKKAEDLLDINAKVKIQTKALIS